MATSNRYLVLTPMIAGFDGISEVSRQIVRGLAGHSRSPRVEAWTLDGPAAVGLGSGVEAWTAEGSKWRLLRRSISRATADAEGLTVVVLHVHLAPLGALFAARGARTIVFLHGIESWRPLRPRERVALLGADCVVANSPLTAERFRAANPWWGARSIAVALLGIGAPAVAPVLPRDTGFALIVGRLAADERYKGHDALIDSWPSVLAAVPHARLVVVGDGDDRSRLERRASEIGVAHSVTFAGRVSDAELLGYYRACAFFVMPSSGEGFGLAYLEAMREAKPCIALRTSDAIVEDGVSGLLLDSAEPASLARAAVTLFSYASERERLGRAAAARVAARFTEAQFTRRFHEAIGLAPSETGDVVAHHRAAGVHA